MDRNSNTDVAINDLIHNIQSNYSGIHTNNVLRGGFDWNTDFKRTFKKKRLSFAFQWSNNKSLTDNIFMTENNPLYALNQKKQKQWYQ